MKVSQLALELKPYVMGWIQEVGGSTVISVQGSAGGVIDTAGWAPSPHEMTGDHHSGYLEILLNVQTPKAHVRVGPGTSS